MPPSWTPKEVFAKSLVLLLVLIFLGILALAIGNASSISGMQAAPKEMRDGYELGLQTFKKRQETNSELKKAKADLAASQDGPPRIEAQRRVDIAQANADAALEDWNVYADNHRALICLYADQLGEIWWPTSSFVDVNKIPKCTRKLAAASDMKAGVALSEASSGTLDTFEEAVIRKQVEKVPLIINFYVLPIIFGCLGALLFSLRALLSDFSTASSLETIPSFYLRLCLGGICGLLIGYLNVPAATTGVSASPLLLSLVAGFSLDTVISVLERISKALRYESEIKVDGDAAKPEVKQSG